MAKPGADPSSGISLGDALILPKRHPACGRREAQLGSCTERENLSLRCQGRHPSGAHHEDQSTDAEHRDGAGPLRVQIRVARHSPNARRVCSSYSPSATLLSARQMSSANGACGRQDRHDSAGMRLVSAAKGWRSSVRRSTDWVVRHVGQRTQRNQCLALRAQPIVGENSIGMRLACRSFHAATRRPASSRI